MILGAGGRWANDPTLTCFPLLPHVHTTRWVPFDKERCLAFVMREIRMHANKPLFTLLNFRINMSQHNKMLPSDANDFK